VSEMGSNRVKLKDPAKKGVVENKANLMKIKSKFRSVTSCMTEKRVTLGSAFVVVLLSVISTGLAQVATPSLTESGTPRKFILLHTFSGQYDGGLPWAGLALDAVGNLYGATQVGGSHGYGAVFKIDAKRKETVLWSFTNLGDGSWPLADVLLDKKGNLFGTTAFGGRNDLCTGQGCGTVFKVSQGGKETTLYQFEGSQYGDGQVSFAGLIADNAGNVYGTSRWGGSSGVGVVFKLDIKGTETVLHSFQSAPDGADPEARVTVDATGNLYGTTWFGGSNFCNCGTVFKIDAAGTYTVLYNFAGQGDGANPRAGLILDAKGNLYGTAARAGAYNGGVLFKVNPKGTENVLYSFGANGIDASEPNGDLVRDTKGNFYGSTYLGGTSGNGAVFKLDHTGKESVLYSFTGGTDGQYPYGGVTMDKLGNLYGTALQGGEDPYGNCAAQGNQGCGVVFKIAVGAKRW